MPFKKGDPKPPNSGKKKGSFNKSSLLVKQVIDEHGINLIEQILVRLKEIPREAQVKALVSLLPYCYPRLTSVEHSGEINNPYLKMELSELEKLVKEKLKK